MTSTAPTSTGMTLDEIKAAVLAGTTVHFGSTAYVVTVDNLGQWFIECPSNGYCIGLTWRDGVTVNGKPEQFFKGDAPCPACSVDLGTGEYHDPGCPNGPSHGEPATERFVDHHPNTDDVVVEWEAFYADPERSLKAAPIDAVRNLGDWLQNEADLVTTVDTSRYGAAADAAYAMGMLGYKESAIAEVVAAIITSGDILP